MALSHRQFSQLQRLRFIEMRLYWEGRINRGDLVDAFGISTVQASSDLNDYLRESPEAMWYDKSGRAYRAAEDFSPIAYTPAAEDHLQSVLRAMRDDRPDEGGAALGWLPEIAMCDVPNRVLPPATLRALLQHLRSGTPLRVEYQSFSAATPRWREIIPTALGSNGARWHVRALCLEDNVYKDFVIARVLNWQPLPEAEMRELPADLHWAQWVRFHIAPHPGLSVGQRRAIELDYAMRDGRAEVRVRRALLWYAVRQLRLEGDAAARPAIEQQIVLADPTELEFDD